MNNVVHQLSVSQLEIGEYVKHHLSKSLIQRYIDDDSLLKRDMPDLRVSHREGRYYVVGGFEVLEALKHQGQELINLKVDNRETVEKEVELYEILNGNSNVSWLVKSHNEMKKINAEYSFRDAVSKLSVLSKSNMQIHFEHSWQSIPESFLYETYKDVLSLVESKSFYHVMFKPELVNKLQKLNKHDTVDNPELINKLDSKGYLTIYHGHVKPTLRNSHSWTPKPEVAHWFGNRSALLNRVDDFYVYTGKVRLDDIIAYITDRKEEEIVVLNKNVKQKTKEFFTRTKDE